jgi:hypothetical protein
MYGDLEPVLKEVPDYKREALRKRLLKKQSTSTNEEKSPQTQDDIAQLIMKRKRGF